MNIGFVDRFDLEKIDCFFVYGTGIDAEDLVDTVSITDKIIAFVDDRRCGNRLYDKDIIKLEDYIKIKQNNPIVITTYRYTDLIKQKLDNYGLIWGDDYFIWDDRHIFNMDDSIKRFISFNSNIWSSKAVRDLGNDSAEILIPFDNKHSLLKIIPQAYCGNYFAEKYNARIKGYFRFGATYDNASEVFLQIYKSINMEELISYKLTPLQIKEVQKISDDIWKHLRTWKDWNEIYIYDIHFGTTIVRYLLRHFVPPFDPMDLSLREFLKDTIGYIVFWYDYISKGNVKAVLLGDGVCWDGFIRDVALKFKIPTYTNTEYFAKMTYDYFGCQSFPYHKKFWDELTKKEKDYGIIWAKKKLEERLYGNQQYINTCGKDKNVFNIKCESRVLENNDKLKVMICPHVFEEDCYVCGEQIYDNNYISWLTHLGELSEITPDYDWYIKMHPSASKRDFIIIDKYLRKYPKIKKIDAMVSPIQLRDEGLKYALTVCGTISYEYPLLGIQVINAGMNHSVSFDFAWNPKSKDEYDELLLNLHELSPKNNYEDIYKCFSIEFLYHKKHLYYGASIFFNDSLLGMERIELKKIGRERGTWMYDEYMNEWTEDKHERIIKEISQIFSDLDNWEPDVFYRNEIGIVE